MKKTTARRIFGSLIASNIGVALMSYAGYKMGWWGNDTMWKALFCDGCWFTVGSLVNLIALTNL